MRFFFASAAAFLLCAAVIPATHAALSSAVDTAGSSYWIAFSGPPVFILPSILLMRLTVTSRLGFFKITAPFLPLESVRTRPPVGLPVDFPTYWGPNLFRRPISTAQQWAFGGMAIGSSREITGYASDAKNRMYPE